MKYVDMIIIILSSALLIAIYRYVNGVWISLHVNKPACIEHSAAKPHITQCAMFTSQLCFIPWSNLTTKLLNNTFINTIIQWIKHWSTECLHNQNNKWFVGKWGQVYVLIETTTFWVSNPVAVQLLRASDATLGLVWLQKLCSLLSNVSSFTSI